MPPSSESLQALTPKERIYVQNRLNGLSKAAAGRAAGLPDDEAYKVEKRERVQAAILDMTNQMAQEIGFSRKEAHDMLMDAYRNAATATEQIQAIRELINLHGVAQPKKVEHEHTVGGQVQIEHMNDNDLMKLANLDNLAIDGEYELVEEKDLLEDFSDK